MLTGQRGLWGLVCLACLGQTQLGCQQTIKIHTMRFLAGTPGPTEITTAETLEKTLMDKVDPLPTATVVPEDGFVSSGTEPEERPTATAAPTAAPTPIPTVVPTVPPSPIPTVAPTVAPTATPTEAPPSNPSGLSSAATGTLSALVSWTAPLSGASGGFRISWKAGGTAPETCGAAEGATQASTADTNLPLSGLAAHTLYAVRVCSANANPTSDVSSGVTASFTTWESAPGNPAVPAATALGADSIGVTWSAPAGGATGGYKLAFQSGTTPPATCGVATGVTLVGVLGESHVVSGLAANTTYAFRICSLNGNPTPDVSTGATASARTWEIPPDNPTALAVLATGTGTLLVSWTAPVSGASGGYRVARNAGASAPATCASGDGEAVASTNATSLLLSGLAPSSLHSVRVCSANANPEPDLSSGVAASGTTWESPPQNPSHAVLSAVSTTSAQLSWDPPAGGASGGYLVKFTSGGVAPAVCTGGVAVATETVLIESLSPHVTYSARICALNGNPVPDASSGLTFPFQTLELPPGDPSGLAVAAVSATSVQASWSAPDGGASGGYLLAYQSGSTPPASCAAASGVVVVAVAGVSKTVAGLDANTEYAFRLCARNSNGNPDVSAGVTATARTLQSPPGNPASLTLTVTGPSTVQVAWAVPASGAAAGYIVAVMAGTPPPGCLGTEEGSTATAAPASPVALTGLLANTTYGVRVCSVNGNPTPDVSSGLVSSARTLESPPGNPTGLAVSATGQTTLQFSWSAPAGGASGGYLLAQAAGTSAPALCAGGTATTGTSLTLTGLTANTTYAVRVCALNSNATPDVSTGATATGTTLPSDAQVATAERDAFSFSNVLNGNSSANDIRTNLQLPVTAGNGVSISWQSDDPSLIATNGAVSLPASSQLFAVTLTATFSKNGAQATSQQTFYVRGRKQITMLPWDTSSGSAAPLGPPTSAAISGNTWLMGSSHGLSATTDAGIIWSHLSLADGLPFTSVHAVAISGTTWIAAGSGSLGSGLAYSTNSGKSWKTLVNDAYGTFVSPEGTLYQLKWNSEWTQQTFSFSDNLGASWTSAVLPIPAGSYGLCLGAVHSIAAQGSSVAIVSGDCDSGGFVGLYVSFDKGQTWSTLPISSWGGNYPSGVDVYGNTIAVATGAGLYFSTNGGGSWAHPWATSANTALARSGLLVAGLASGVSRSINAGVNWATLTTGFGLPYVEFLTGPASRMFAATCPDWKCAGFGRSGLSMSTDNGATWSQRSLTLTPEGLSGFSAANGRLSYVEQSSHKVVTSTDSGATWNAYGSAFGKVKLAGALTYLSQYYSGVIFRSADGGATTTAALLNDATGGVRHLEADGNTVVVGLSSFPMKIRVSTDGGATWPVSTSNFVTGTYKDINSLSVRGSRIVVATDYSGIGFSLDSGATWGEATIANGKVTQSRFWGSAVGEDGTLYVNHFRALIFSTDNGATWQEKAAPTGVDLYDRIVVSNGKVMVKTFSGIAGYDTQTDTWRVWNFGNIAMPTDPVYADLVGTDIFAAGNSLIFKFPWSAQ